MASTPLLKFGAASSAVRRLQRGLNAADAAGLPVTGVFEAGTTAAVKRYQRDHGLAQTGVVTTALWSKLQPPPPEPTSSRRPGPEFTSTRA